MKIAILVVLSTTISIVSGAVSCDVNLGPKSWATIDARNVFFNAWQPTNYMKMSGFCVLNDFFTRTLEYWSHVNLAGKATVQNDECSSEDIGASQINCALNSSSVAWCTSHCQNKSWESLIIQSAINNGSLPLAVSQQVYQQLNSPSDVSIAAISISQTSDNWVSYDYYDDENFCSVYLKVNQTEIPYVLLLTVQRVY